MTLAALIEQSKHERFRFPSTVTDEKALGVLIAAFFKWDGASVLRTCAAALEDANFHAEARSMTTLSEVI